MYDRLANAALLAHARSDVERIYAGKQPDRHAMTQDEINALLGGARTARASASCG